jgi:hypothetical protein
LATTEEQEVPRQIRSTITWLKGMEGAFGPGDDCQNYYQASKIYPRAPLGQPRTNLRPPAPFQCRKVCIQQSVSFRFSCSAVTNSIFPDHAGDPRAVGPISSQLASPSSLPDGCVKNFLKHVQTFARIPREPWRLSCQWHEPVVPLLISRGVFPAKLCKLFIESGVPFGLGNFTVHICP